MRCMSVCAAFFWSFVLYMYVRCLALFFLIRFGSVNVFCCVTVNVFDSRCEFQPMKKNIIIITHIHTQTHSHRGSNTKIYIQMAVLTGCELCVAITQRCVCMCVYERYWRQRRTLCATIYALRVWPLYVCTRWIYVHIRYISSGIAIISQLFDSLFASRTHSMYARTHRHNIQSYCDQAPASASPKWINNRAILNAIKNHWEKRRTCNTTENQQQQKLQK